MPVDSRHPEYDAMFPKWVKCRDTVDGEEAVKDAGTKYLPPLGGQLLVDSGSGSGARSYAAYKKRAVFYGATGRTAQGLVGAILRRDPDRKIPLSEEQQDRIGQAGDPIEEVENSHLGELVAIGRHGLFVDAPEQDSGEPYIAEYTAESITNWSFDIVEGRKTLVMVTLREDRKVHKPDDPFCQEVEPIYRVLRIGPNPLIMVPALGGESFESTMERVGLRMSDFDRGEMIYWQEIWKKDETKVTSGEDEWVLERVIIPKKNGGRLLNRIPFYVSNSEGTGIRPVKPVLLDVANLNLSHYRNSADLEHGLHYTALPTPWAAGFSNTGGEDGEDNELHIGSETAWVTDEPTARAGFLEFTGAGLGALQEEMKSKEKLMAVLGARLLESREKQVESSETVQLRSGGEQCALARIANAASRTMTKAMTTLCDWVSPGKKAEITFNRDFNLVGLTPQEIASMMAALQGGLISWQTWFYNLKRGELIPPGVDEKQEAKLIEAGLPEGISSDGDLGEEDTEDEEDPDNVDPDKAEGEDEDEEKEE